MSPGIFQGLVLELINCRTPTPHPSSMNCHLMACQLLNFKLPPWDLLSHLSKTKNMTLKQESHTVAPLVFQSIFEYWPNPVLTTLGFSSVIGSTTPKLSTQLLFRYQHLTILSFTPIYILLPVLSQEEWLHTLHIVPPDIKTHTGFSWNRSKRTQMMSVWNWKKVLQTCPWTSIL